MKTVYNRMRRGRRQHFC